DPARRDVWMTAPRRFLPLLAATAGFVLLHQTVDLSVLIPSVDLVTPAGRVRWFLALEARSPGALVGDFLLLVSFILWGARPLCRAAGLLHLILGPLLLGLAAWFLADASPLATGMGGNELLAFQVVVVRALLMFALAGVGAILAGRTLLVW